MRAATAWSVQAARDAAGFEVAGGVSDEDVEDRVAGQGGDEHGGGGFGVGDVGSPWARSVVIHSVPRR
ncbi:hypothetical protein OHS18_05710 [Amycolatopsis sp. NBC_00355]|uniref:hypothetical protein n=1 Tax=Amycolatopsis sp. NBC_00355 TaxID=2975957 RepID=UPI002E25D121